MEYQGGANSGTSKRDEILEGVPVKVDGEWLIAIDKRDAPRPGDLVRVRTKRGESWTTTIIAILSEQGGRFGERYEPRVIVRGDPVGQRRALDEQRLMRNSEQIATDRDKGRPHPIEGEDLLAVANELSQLANDLTRAAVTVRRIAMRRNRDPG